MKKIMFIGLVAAVVVAIAVEATIVITNDKDASPSNSSSSDTVTQPLANNGTSTENSQSVTIKDMVFNPKSITIKKGSTVTWTNSDSISHSVVFDSTGMLKGTQSKNLTTGDSYQFTFNENGVYTYHCGIHSSMKGTITVE